MEGDKKVWMVNVITHVCRRQFMHVIDSDETGRLRLNFKFKL